MEQKLTKKYGLLTAIAMVVGIVIGSGVFFKAETILQKTGGDLMPSILAWVICGLIMVICAVAFAVMATQYERVGGVVDYAEATMGGRYAYFVGWFMSTVYLPAMTSVLSWVSARYTIVFLSSVIPGFAPHPVVSAECMVITLFYMVASYALNALAPKLAGKFQITTTVIKLIPLIAMGVIGTIVGLTSGQLVDNFAVQSAASASRTSLFFVALVSTAFAYEGWVIATSINAEIKDSKRNLPIALGVGSLIVMIICVLYNLGIAGVVGTETLAADGGASKAFQTLFGEGIGAVLNLFVAISCLGTLNGLMLVSTRSMYSIAVRGNGPKADTFAVVDEKTNMPSNSSIIGLVLVAFWFLYFYGANLAGWAGSYGFDSSELPIITIYALYVPIFVMFIAKSKGLGVFKRFILPVLAICSCVFMVVAAVIAHKMGVVYYLVMFAIFMAVGMIFYNKKK